MSLTKVKRDRTAKYPIGLSIESAEPDDAYTDGTVLVSLSHADGNGSFMSVEPGESVADAIAYLCRDAGIPESDIVTFCHGDVGTCEPYADWRARW